MKVCGKAGADSKYCTDSCGGYYDASQTVWADGYVYRYFIMGPYNGISDICANDLWRAGVVCMARTVSGTAFSSCSYNFASFYPFTPLCLRGCVPADVGIYCKDLTTSTSRGYTDVTKIKTTVQLPLNPNDCKLVSGTYYQPYPNACSRNSTTGVYLYNPTTTPTKAPTSLPPTRAPTSVIVLPTRGPSVAPSTISSASPTIVPAASLPPTRGPSSVAPTAASVLPTKAPSVAPSKSSVVPSSGDLLISHIFHMSHGYPFKHAFSFGTYCRYMHGVASTKPAGNRIPLNKNLVNGKLLTFDILLTTTAAVPTPKQSSPPLKPLTQIAF